MQEFPHTGGASNDRRAARQTRLFATFKLATSHVEMLSKRNVTGAVRTAANVNRRAVAMAEPSQTGRP
jgi:hypothetical protein